MRVRGLNMARPEIDDEVVERIDKIIDDATVMPLPAERFSVNEKLMVLVSAVEEHKKESLDFNENLIDKAFEDS